jgi:transcription antitermination factor NusG
MVTNTPNPQWYVAFTRPQTEKKVAKSISDMGIECFLPLHTVVRQWSDREKKIEIPLFPNYVFIKVEEAVRYSLFSVKDLVKFVSFEKKPVVIRDKEIMVIKNALDPAFEVSRETYVEEGMKVKITHGCFGGMEGIIKKVNSRTRFVVKIDVLMQAFSFNISSNIAEILVVPRQVSQKPLQKIETLPIQQLR